MSELKRSDWKRTSTEGPSLFHVECRAPSPRAVLGVVHGYADYAERYEKPMKVWADKGLTSVAVDLRGHGRSGGERGHAMAFSDYVDDFRELLAMMKEIEAPELPRVLFAHSFGAPVALKSMLSGLGDFRALALSEPFLAPGIDVPSLKRAAGVIASKLVPSLGLPSGLTGQQMSTDPEAARAYDNDPLIFKNARARWFTETEKAQTEILARAGEIKLPLLVLFGTEDRVVREASAREFFDRCGAKDKTWEKLDGLKHEPLNEPQHGARIAARIADFLLTHL